MRPSTHLLPRDTARERSGRRRTSPTKSSTPMVDEDEKAEKYLEEGVGVNHAAGRVQSLERSQLAIAVSAPACSLSR